MNRLEQIQKTISDYDRLDSSVRQICHDLYPQEYEVDTFLLDGAEMRCICHYESNYFSHAFPAEYLFLEREEYRNDFRKRCREKEERLNSAMER